MTDDEVLYLLNHGIYIVDKVTAEVIGSRGFKIRPTPEKEGEYLFVRLFSFDGEIKRFRKIALHRLVWMSVTKELIPAGWEVHHRDEDKGHNAWSNLICVHRLDHEKFHPYNENEPIPF